jgi:Do/DeqQ family serine protease
MTILRAPLYLSVAALLAACSPSHSQDASKFQGQGFAEQPRKLPDSALGMKESFAPVVKVAAPAVVNVYAKSVVRQQVDPFWQMFYGVQPRNQVQQSLGSGVIVRKDGIIVTNNHVIEGGQQFMVVLSDRRQYSAKVLLADPRTDLAVLKIDTKGENLPTLTLDDDRDLQVGDLVLAIGNPFGVGQTVTNGIISALNRSDVGAGMGPNGPGGQGGDAGGNYIQTDAAINPGNSGGALVDMNGHLIGINSMILSGAGQSSGVGFAIPAPLVKRVIETAVGGADHLTHVWLGVKGDTVTGDIASSLGMARPQGVLVSDVYPGGPADKAGVKTGDVITSLNDQPLNDAAALNYQINLLSPGDSVSAQLLRGGKSITVSLKAEAPSANPPKDERLLKGENPFAGAKVVNLSPAVADELGIDPFSAPKGVMISGIWGGYAANVGLQPGDIIRAVNGRTISTTADLAAAVQAGANRWRITIVRGGQTITATFG